jgi:hypothetical protein
MVLYNVVVYLLDKLWLKRTKELGLVASPISTARTYRNVCYLRGRLIDNSEKKRINWLLRELSYDKKC